MKSSKLLKLIEAEIDDIYIHFPKLNVDDIFKTRNLTDAQYSKIQSELNAYCYTLNKQVVRMLSSELKHFKKTFAKVEKLQRIFERLEDEAFK